MAQNIIAQVLGGDKKVLDNASTVREVKEKMNASGYQATVNGDPAKDSDSLSDGDFVSLVQAVKGGC